MSELIATSVRAVAKLNTDIQDTVIGEIAGAKEFRVTVTIEYVSSGDFSKYEAPDINDQYLFNKKLERIVQSKLISNSIQIP